MFLKRFIVFLAVFVIVAWVILIRIRNGSPVGFGHYNSPAWSPDGRYLAFAFSDTGLDELWILEIATGNAKKLNISDLQSYDGIIWRDNNTIYMICGSSLCRMDIRINKQEEVIEAFPSSIVWIGPVFETISTGWNGFSFEPDNSSLTISRWRGPLNLYNPSELYSLDLATNSMIQLTDTKDISEENPIWSPNGEYLAYATHRDFDIDTGSRGQTAIEIKKNDTTYTLDVPITLGTHHLAWLPHNKYLLFRANSKTDAGLYIVPIDQSSERKQILYPAGGLATFALSPDGSKLAYTTVGVPGGNHLYIVDIKI